MGGIEAGTQSWQEEVSEVSVVCFGERRLCRLINPVAYWCRRYEKWNWATLWPEQ